MTGASFRPVDHQMDNPDHNPASCWWKLHHRSWNEFTNLVLHNAFRHMVYRMLMQTKVT